MTADSELLEFTLENTDATDVIKTTKKSTSANNREFDTLITKIVKNFTKKPLSPTALSFINNYWQPVMHKVAEQYGIGDIKWRECVKKLNGLSLYLEAETRKKHPQVITELLPSLLHDMEQDIKEYGMTNSSLSTALKEITQYVIPTGANTVETSTNLSVDPVNNEHQEIPLSQSEETLATVDLSNLEFESFDAESDFELQGGNEHLMEVESNNALPPLELEVVEEAMEIELTLESSDETNEDKVEKPLVTPDVDLPPLKLED